MSSPPVLAPAIPTWSWIGRKLGSVEITSSPGFRRARVAMYSPSIPPFVIRTSWSSRPRSSFTASGSPKRPRLKGYRLYSASSTLRRIASLIGRGIGIVFVFWDIHTTSRRCSWANSKLSIDPIRSRHRGELHQHAGPLELRLHAVHEIDHGLRGHVPVLPPVREVMGPQRRLEPHLLQATGDLGGPVAVRRDVEGDVRDHAGHRRALDGGTD